MGYFVSYKNKNLKGIEKEYDVLIDENEMIPVLDRLFMEEFNLSWDSFKELYNNDFLEIDYDDLVERYHDDLLKEFEDEIEEHYREEIENEKELEEWERTHKI